MPGGISDPVAGYATFAVIKFAGYCAAGFVLGRCYPGTRTNAAVAGLARTVIGLVAGAVYGLLVGSLADALGGLWVILFLAGLVPVRLAEWWLLIWLLYDRGLAARAKGWGLAAGGTAWSFVLDVPALIGAIVTAGIWIC